MKQTVIKVISILVAGSTAIASYADDRSSIALNDAVCTNKEEDVNFYLRLRDVKIDFVNETTGKSTLGCAFSSGNMNIIKMLLTDPFVSADPYFLDTSGLYALEYAKSEEVLVVMKELVPNFDVNHPDGFGTNVLSCVDENSNSCMPSSLHPKIIELWPEARSIQMPPPEACFQLNGSTIASFSCAHRNVIIPEKINGVTVTAIGNGAFYFDYVNGDAKKHRMISVVIPDTVTSIGARAFTGRLLKSVVIPDSVETIGPSAFTYNELTEVVLPSRLKVISDEAFEANHLVSVVIPEGVTAIGDSAFHLNDLTKVVWPTTLKAIGKWAFQANELTDLQLPNGVLSIGDFAFSGAKLRNLKIPDSVISIGEEAFRHCEMETLVLGSSVKTIGDCAFCGRTGVNDYANNFITAVSIPDSVKSIGAQAFTGNKISQLNLGSGLTTIGDRVFQDNFIAEVVIPVGVTRIGWGAFGGNGMTSLKLPQGLNVIEEHAFLYNKLTNVEIPNSVTEIRSRAFGQNKMESVVLPNSVTKLDPKAFDESVQIIRE